MKIILVDETDHQIGVGEYETAKFSDIYRVSGLWLTNEKNDILLAQRKFNKLTDPGKWGPAVAGTIEVGETYEDNIYKEALEEIGLSGFKFQVGPKVFNGYNQGRKFFVQWFLCTCDWPLKKFKIQQDEVEQIAWVNHDQLTKDLDLNPERYIVGAKQVWAEFI